MSLWWIIYTVSENVYFVTVFTQGGNIQTLRKFFSKHIGLLSDITYMSEAFLSHTNQDFIFADAEIH